MTDPVFTTRAELEKWAVERAKATWPYSHEAKLRTIDELKRVTLAHSHLMEGNSDD